jgi:hypothetical protein
MQNSEQISEQRVITASLPEIHLGNYDSAVEPGPTDGARRRRQTLTSPCSAPVLKQRSAHETELKSFLPSTKPTFVLGFERAFLST